MNAPRRALIALCVTALFPLGLLGYQLAVNRAWVPDWPNETIRFLNYHIAHAMDWYRTLAALELLWGCAFLLAVAFAPQLRAYFGARFFPVLLGIQAFGLIVMVASPFPMDSDQYAYVYYGDLTLTHVNPYPQYTKPLPRLTHEESRVAVHWDNPPYVDRYGPAWTLANAAVLRPFLNASAETQARVLRIVAALAALGCTLLIASLLPQVPWRDSALVAFALNPLFMVSSGNGGHNDVYLLLFGLLAWWLAKKGQFELAAASLATAVCVKFAYAPLLPALLAYVFVASRSFVRLITSITAFAAVTVLWALPLGLTTSLLEPVLGWNSNHLPHISYYLWRIAVHAFHVHATQKPFGMIVPLAAIGIALAIAFYGLRERRIPALEMTMAILILLLPYKIESWYALMLAPLLLVRARFAFTMFLAITLSFQFLQMRIFLEGSNPYVLLTALAIIVAVVIEDVLPRSRARLQTS